MSRNSHSVDLKAPAAAHPLGADRHRHVVHFYETDAFLIDSVADFVGGALRTGQAAVVIATEAHRKFLERALSVNGCDLATAGQQGRFVCLDATETLARFTVEGVPDPSLFADVVGGVIARAGRDGREVRAFGEMVALLWAGGNVQGAITLESLWNDLESSLPFSLLCAYPIQKFDDDTDGRGFAAVCEQHSGVIPAESFSGITARDDRLRAVASLQQKTRAVEREREDLRLQQVELESTLERLKERDRMRTEFVAMLVHDIRAPTAVIAGFLELLRENWEALGEDRVRDLLTRGIDNTRQINQLVDGMLTVSRIDSGHFTYDNKPFDIAEVIYRAVGGVKDTTPRVCFDVSIPSDLPTAFGDESRQMQILNNLLTNAAKFSPDDSTVSVGVEVQGDHLAIGVRDQGVGIEPQDIARLFRRFSRLRQPGYENVRGTGLGLYIARAIVQGQGGEISVQSSKGRGSTFTYTVPIAR